MPCKSDYLESDFAEREMSKVVVLLDELDGKGVPDPKTYGNGYDSRVYNKGWTDEKRDVLVAELCTRLQKVKNIKKYSLELQIWKRNHDAADKTRLEFELLQQKTKAQRQKVLNKLTPHERKLLGV
jgi:hypothetical protein